MVETIPGDNKDTISGDAEEEVFDLEKLEVGDPNDIYVDQTPRLEYFVYKGKKYPFKIVELTWSQVDKIIDDSMTFVIPKRGRVKDPIPNIDIPKLQRSLFLTMVSEHPFKEPLEQAYYKLPLAFREWILGFMPDIGVGLPLKEQKK